MHSITKKQLISLVVIVSLLIISIIVTVLLKREDSITSTGGSGVPKEGTLVLRGYDTPTTNSQTKTPVGKYLSVTQQSNIRLYLEALLYNKKPQAEYRGTIIAGSPSMDSRTNILTFKIQIDDPDVTYTIHYTITGTEMRVFDEQGKELKPVGA